MADDVAPQVAALLLNWRQPELTMQCLRDLLAVRDVSLHVVVIDNGSDDGGSGAAGAGEGSVTALKRAVQAANTVGGLHRVEFLGLPQNLGFTGGMNEGLRRASAAGAPFVLVLNNDLRLAPDFLRPLVSVLAKDPRVAAVGPTVLQPDGTVWAEGGSVGLGPNALRLRGHGRQPALRTSGPMEVAFLPGACVLFRTAEMVTIGGFDDDYFMYWEDVELCARLRERGGRIVWLPWVSVVHEAGQSSGGGRSPLRKFLMANNAVRYLRAHGTIGSWAGWFLFDVVLWPVALLAGPRAAFAKLRGTVAGLCGHRASARDVGRFLRHAGRHASTP